MRISPRRLNLDRILPFQGKGTGSNPVGAVFLLALFLVFSISFAEEKKKSMPTIEIGKTEVKVEKKKDKDTKTIIVENKKKVFQSTSIRVEKMEETSALNVSHTIIAGKYMVDFNVWINDRKEKDFSVGLTINW